MSKTYTWWKFLFLMAIINTFVWVWALAVRSDMQDFSYAQPILSGIYVFVCAFRSFFPRIDLERYCLFDNPLSSVTLGRTAATIAEICFSIQCAILLYELGIFIQSPAVTFISYSIVPLIVIAQISCWYATLTLNHFWHGVEELLWTVMIALAAGCLIAGFIHTTGIHQMLMVIGIISCLGSAYIMLFVDIPMYFSRMKEGSSITQPYLTVMDGIKDASTRRVQTADWDIWKKEVLWISSYFTVGVWLSISMIFIQF